MAKKHKVLIVDDELDILKTMVMILEDICEVLTASNGRDALAAVSKEKPSFMLLDVSMPGMDGLAVLEALREMGIGVMVVMLTSNVEIEIAKRALTLGARQYITKPFDADDLRAEIKRLIASLGKEDGPDQGRPWRTVR